MIGNRPGRGTKAARRQSRAKKPTPLAVFVVLLLAGCISYESAYERAVYDDEPVYCYQSLGSVDCYRKPYRRDDARLVNYYGPSPARTAPPKRTKPAEPQPPPDDDAVAEAATADPGSGSASAASDWSDWLPLISLGFGALQVVAAFVL